MVDLNTPKCSGMLPFIASCTTQHRWPNRLACKDTHRNDARASADDTFDLTIFFAKRFWKDCNCFICVVRPGWSPHTPHFPHSALSILRTFHTPHFPHSAFSILRTFHTPHFPHSAVSTLLIFHTPHSALHVFHPTGNVDKVGQLYLFTWFQFR